jgi:hypothetical protein
MAGKRPSASKLQHDAFGKPLEDGWFEDEDET